MRGREYLIDPEYAPHTPIALFDEHGKLHGWSPTFADDCAPSTVEFRLNRISDFWPEFDAVRWADIWRKTQVDGSATIVHVLARNRQCEHSEMIELEIGQFLAHDTPLAKVEIRRAASRRLQLLQQDMLEAMASGVPLKGILESLCRRVEAMAPSVICSVLAVDRGLQLRHIASPSLPQHYSAAIDGLLIGPKTGSCGTAAFRGEPVEVTDIATDPLWEDFKHLALPLGLRACWSTPIKGADGVIGAFAFYYPRPRGPNMLERQVVATCVNLCTIALEHEKTRARAYEQAYVDPLTRLPNRARIQQRVSETMGIVAETGQRICVQYIGLDHFQAVNEILGYAQGDELLRVIAARLQGLVKDSDAVARIGGDEYAVIQVGDFSDEDVATRARQIIDLIGEPFLACGQRLDLGASVGIAIGPDDGNTADELIQDAALAMRRVKELGRGSYMFYEKELNARMQARRRAKSELREAVAGEQFELYFQPIIDLNGFEIAGAEALIRWHHPERGMVSPAEFIPLAEKCGLIDQLGAWVIRDACLAAATWPGNMSVAVNLSPVQFAGPGLVRTVAAALAESGLDPARLELEITESVLLHDSAVNIAMLDELSHLGVSIALDDFGTGYSSLSYLRRFSFDRIKIDHSFVRDITHNEGSLKIVRAIVMLAHSLGLAVTAEGVETDDQLAAVRGEGCDSVQGHYTGSPVPIASFREQVGIPGRERVSAA